MNAALPNWSLDDLYQSPLSSQLEEDKARLRQQIEAFANSYKRKLPMLSADDFAKAIIAYEQIEEGLGKLASYSDLIFSTDTTNPQIVAVYQDLQEFVSDCASELVFFTLEINALDEAVLESFIMGSDAVRRYRPWLEDVRLFRPYQLEEQLEQLLIDKSITSSNAWVRLYEDISNRMEIPLDGETLNLTQALDLLSHPVEATRRSAAFALSASFEKQADSFALIYNTLIRDKAIDDKWRRFERPVSSRNLANLVEDEIVDTLANSVSNHYKDLSERYYKIKAGWLGKDRLDYWDRNAPLPGADESNISWDEARQIILEAYMGFSPEMAKIADDFFTRKWIDAPVKPGKTSGAFSHPTVPSVHPYILMNYQGKIRDVMTLAHELGHGVHQVLSASQGALMSDTPLTLAETASVFGEQLTFQYLLNRERDEAVRKRLIASKVEDMLNTVVRQIAFYQFETTAHEMRKEGELSVDAISRLWLEKQAASFGDAIQLHESYRFFWTYISHFYHTPFYVYAYAFGDCLVNSLYALYEEAKAEGKANVFEQRYLEMLRAGGSKRHKELLAPFGIDISQPDFWEKGLAHISRYIDMLDG